MSKHVDSRLPVDVHIYCDGACEPNPGECSTGIAIYKDNKLESLHFGLYKELSTNNVAELNGLLSSLKIAKQMIEEKKSVQILCDSMYAINCVTQWSYSWKQKGWVKGKNEEIKNLSLIQEAHIVYESIKDKVKVSHIKGHNGFEGNELADRMSILGIKNKEPSLKKYEGDLNVEEILEIKV